MSCYALDIIGLVFKLFNLVNFAINRTNLTQHTNDKCHHILVYMGHPPSTHLLKHEKENQEASLIVTCSTWANDTVASLESTNLLGNSWLVYNTCYRVHTISDLTNSLSNNQLPVPGHHYQVVLCISFS